MDADGTQGSGRLHDLASTARLVSRGDAATPENVQGSNTFTPGSSWSLPVDDGAYAKVPCWFSKTQWLEFVLFVSGTDEGKAKCVGGVAAQTSYAFAEAVAAHADSATGRNCTASLATLAAYATKRMGRDKPFSKRTATNALATLRNWEAACEMARGRHLTTEERNAAAEQHGKPQKKAASVWAATIPRSLAAAAGAVHKHRRGKRSSKEVGS